MLLICENRGIQRVSPPMCESNVFLNHAFDRKEQETLCVSDTTILSDTMIPLKHHQISSSLPVETIHARIEQRLTNNIGLALSPSQQFLFSGTLTHKGFTLSPIQKGRIFPMPRLYGTYHMLEDRTDIIVIGKPGTSSMLNIIVWFFTGVGASIYAMSSYGIYAIGFMIFPLLYIGLQIWLLNKEIRLGLASLTDIIDEDFQTDP